MTAILKSIKIRKAGRLRYFREKSKSEGYRAFNAFWHEAFRGIAKQITKLMAEEVPFQSERQLAALLCPPLNDLTDWLMTEHRVERDGGNGFIDYYLKKDGRYSMMEVKYCELSGRKTVPSSQALQEWDSALEQIKGLKKEMQYWRKLEYETDALVLLVAPVFYRSRQRALDVEQERDRFMSETVNGLANELIAHTEPDILVYWEQEAHLAACENWGSDRNPDYRHYPGVFFVLKVAS